ncbi:MerR family transcriptional regulator [Aestuariivirga sp.]|uniref:MerR family transcriptional regulator n=1 Tax=Aestuariivirga sp. TaxID=2650926 RepID=UPI00391CE8AB
MAEKSPDAFRTISEAAEELDVPQHVLRFWETRFTQIKPMKRAGGRRYYRPADVELLKGIRGLLYKEGYTIRGVQKILKEDGAGYVAAVGRGEIEPRKREGEMASAPPPGLARAAPRLGRGRPADQPAPVAPPTADVRVVNRLSDSQADMLRAALRDLGDARKILDPTLPR